MAENGRRNRVFAYPRVAVTNEPILPRHVPEQIALYQGDHLLTHEICPFDAGQATIKLQHRQTVMAIDIGGDKIRSATYRIGDGALVQVDEVVHQARGGEGYLVFLERQAEIAIANDMRVGISSATKLSGSRVTRTVNLPIFFEAFGRHYDADYEHLFPGRSFVANDTITGICGASTLLALQGSEMQDMAFFICASGLGASVIKDHLAIHVEAAHVPLVDALNPLGQSTHCNVDGKDYVCLERVTASRAGIEPLYQQRTGEAKDGIALGKLYESGDSLATMLFETSALALAHAVMGVEERFGFSDSGDSVVVFHGGMFENGKYRDELRRCLGEIPGPLSRLVFSRDLSANVCLDGAAILAVSYDR
jgi:hypothetical protein